MSQLPTPSTSRAAASAVDRIMSGRAQQLLTVLTIIFLCIYFSLPADHPLMRYPNQFKNRPITKFASSEPPRMIDWPSETITEYLDKRFPNVPEGAESMSTMPDGSQLGPHIWVTMADRKWISSGAFGLHQFVEQLNEERAVKYGANTRRTVLVTLCLDEDCNVLCEGLGMYCYGGHMWTRPPQIIVSTWPKLATLIEVLKTRDLFFVDSDVGFKKDPYPLMEPLMRTHDLVAQENDSWDHFNTGWMWLRRGQAVSDAWQKVLDMDLVKKSRDQNNFNAVLDTTKQRQPPAGYTQHRLLEEFTAPNGLRVHVLNARLFYSWHFERDAPRWTRTDSVSMHITCGDDEPTKVFMLKTLGYWPDTHAYYSNPRSILSLNALGGTQQEVAQIVKIAATIAYYSQRAIQPPTHVVFTDVREWEDNITSSPISSLPSYSSFPWAHINRDFDGKVSIVEPMYAQNAARYLLGGSVLGQGESKEDLHRQWDQGLKGAASALNMLHPKVIDIRSFGSLGHLVHEAVKLAQHGHLRLEGFNLAVTDPESADDSAGSALTLEETHATKEKHDIERAAPIALWKDWALPEPAAWIKTCYNLSRPAGCETICRFPRRGDRRIDVKGEWPSLQSIYQGETEGLRHWSEIPEWDK